jgi:hypothetical protein
MAKTGPSRLSPYGLKPAEAFSHALVVPQGKSLTLSAPNKKMVGYVTLIPKTIDDVKRWIGVPNHVGKWRNLPIPSVSDLAVGATLAASAVLTKPQRVSLRNLANQYVYGDSTGVAHYSAAISAILTNSSIAGLFILQDVDVLPNSELKLAANLGVFCANNIRIWKGGQITLLGDIKIDCQSIIGDYTARRFPTVLETSLGLGILSTIGG